VVATSSRREVTAAEVSGDEDKRELGVGLAFETLAMGGVLALDSADRQSVTHRMVLRECIPWADPDAMAMMSSER
jgi:hypothetical protein